MEVPSEIQTTHPNSKAGFSLLNSRDEGLLQEARALRWPMASRLPLVRDYWGELPRRERQYLQRLDGE